MRTFFTLLVIFTALHNAVAQTPYTIIADEFPIFGQQNFDFHEEPATQGFESAVNGTWDYSNYHSGEFVVTTYETETLPVFTEQGIDVFLPDFKLMNAQLGYELDYEYDFNAEGVFEKAIYVQQQTYPLTALTGGADDVMSFPLQNSFSVGSRQLMAFPATYGSTWQSESRRTVDFNLTVAAAGLNSMPCQHKFTVFRTDSVAGWGTMQVHSENSLSIPYEVLVVKATQYTVDSFFMAGSPAPIELLNVFSASQGQVLNSTTRYLIYRQGYSTPLAHFQYNNDNPALPFRTFIDTDNLTTFTDVEDEAQIQTAVLLFPNPTKSNEINVQFLGESRNLVVYKIADAMGRVVQTGELANGTGTSTISCPSLPDGLYHMQIFNDSHQIQVQQQFLIQR